ncbi:MAG: DUF3467 domain-containing protein [candidate division Zixibacteria bacterium CG_4_9_14_3_um_filter_46_8]|nr:MAG: DUF3467 domain-containing protein [candidate division Zixibacteria bacterium CG_4_9_14_3_um_filter_46_8]
MEQKPMQINIELGEKESEGIYSNLALIVFSPSEIILDFARIMPGRDKGKLFARIVMTPQNAKTFMLALQDNIRKFESQFGEIKVVGKPSQDKNIGFHVSRQNGEKEE